MIFLVVALICISAQRTLLKKRLAWQKYDLKRNESMEAKAASLEAARVAERLQAELTPLRERARCVDWSSVARGSPVHPLTWGRTPSARRTGPQRPRSAPVRRRAAAGGGQEGDQRCPDQDRRPEEQDYQRGAHTLSWPLKHARPLTPLPRVNLTVPQENTIDEARSAANKLASDAKKREDGIRSKEAEVETLTKELETMPDPDTRSVEQRLVRCQGSPACAQFSQAADRASVGGARASSQREQRNKNTDYENKVQNCQEKKRTLIEEARTFERKLNQAQAKSVGPARLGCVRAYRRPLMHARGTLRMRRDGLV